MYLPLQERLSIILKKKLYYLSEKGSTVSSEKE